MCKKKPHKHAEVIKAWADGAEIEFKDCRTGTWYAVSEIPIWSTDVEYRAKPEPKLYRAYQSVRSPESVVQVMLYNTEVECPYYHTWVSEPFEVKLIS